MSMMVSQVRSCGFIMYLIDAYQEIHTYLYDAPYDSLKVYCLYLYAPVVKINSI